MIIEEILANDIDSFICDDPDLQDPDFELTEEAEAWNRNTMYIPCPSDSLLG